LTLSSASLSANTFASPVLQQPLRHGAAFSVHSATKYIGGHGDAMGGVVLTSPELAASLRPLRTVTGGVMDPFTAYLMLRGLGTLPVRMRAAQESATVIAQWLAEQSGIDRVFYPGLPGADPAGLIGTQMSGPGAMLAFEMSGGFTAAERLCSSLDLITHAVSLGGIDTLIEHPASLTHRVVTQTAQPHEAVLRISVGLEDPVDLIADLRQALSKSS